MGRLRRPAAQRNSAVLVFNHLTPWSIVQTDAGLYHHPWAFNPYSMELTLVTQSMVIDGKLSQTNGARIWEILGLNQDWPYG